MQLFINNWSASLLQPLAADATTLAVDPAAAVRLEGLGNGDNYLLTLIGTDDLGNETAWEIVRVTAAAGGSLTIERAQEGTAAQAWSAGAGVEMRITAGAMSGLRDMPGPAGPAGAQGDPGLSAYQIALGHGFVGDEASWLASLQGDAGQDGAAGASAYDVAVEAGFVGDEASWLASLKGEPGDTGPQGDDGPPGPAGPAGPAGAGLQILGTLPSTGDLPVSGAPGDGYLIGGNLWVWSVDQWIDAGLIQGPQGPAGPTGPVGAAGAAGSDGASAYQIALANGYDGSEVEWLASLQGPAGAAGEQGPAGPAGADGETLPAPVAESAATSITLALADAGQYLRTTNAAAVTITVPAQASVAWAAYTEIHIEQGGAGAVTISAGAGVTVNRLSGATPTVAGRYGVVTLKRIAENTWTLFGALGAA